MWALARPSSLTQTPAATTQVSSSASFGICAQLSCCYSLRLFLLDACTILPNMGLADLVFSVAPGANSWAVSSLLMEAVVCAAIGSEPLCAQAGGLWTPLQCSVTSQPACTEHGGSWLPAPMWTLEGGVDLLIVGLLQVLLLLSPCPVTLSAAVSDKDDCIVCACANVAGA